MIKKHLFLNKKSSFYFCVLTASLSVWLVCVLRPLCNIALQCPLATHLCTPVSETFFLHCQVPIGLNCCQLHKFGLHNYLQYLVSPVFFINVFCINVVFQIFLLIILVHVFLKCWVLKFTIHSCVCTNRPSHISHLSYSERTPTFWVAPLHPRLEFVSWWIRPSVLIYSEHLRPQWVFKQLMFYRHTLQRESRRSMCVWVCIRKYSHTYSLLSCTASLQQMWQRESQPSTHYTQLLGTY